MPLPLARCLRAWPDGQRQLSVVRSCVGQSCGAGRGARSVGWIRGKLVRGVVERVAQRGERRVLRRPDDHADRDAAARERGGDAVAARPGGDGEDEQRLVVGEARCAGAPSRSGAPSGAAARDPRCARSSSSRKLSRLPAGQRAACRSRRGLPGRRGRPGSAARPTSRRGGRRPARASSARRVKNSFTSSWWASLARAGDRDRGLAAPAQLAALDAERFGGDVRAGLVEQPVVGRAALARLPRRPEAVEHAQLVELGEPLRGAPARAEVEAAQLLGGEDAVLVAGERDQPVALGQARGERGDSRGADAPRPSLQLRSRTSTTLSRARTDAGSRRTCGGFAARWGRSGPDRTPDRMPDPTPHATTDGAAAHRALCRRRRLPLDELGLDLRRARCRCVRASRRAPHRPARDRASASGSVVSVKAGPVSPAWQSRTAAV